MSNHSGSHMLNEMISLLRRERVFERLGKKRSQRIVLEMLRRAQEEYDCNPGEILEGCGAELGLCYYCMLPAEDVVVDICRKCRAELGCSKEELRTSWRPRRRAMRMART